MSVARDHLCIIRGGGDLGTGVAWRLTRAGFPVLVLELDKPLAVRRTVALSTAVTAVTIDIEGMRGRRVDSVGDATEAVTAGEVAVLVSPDLPRGADASVVVDARLAKRNIDTGIDDAPLVIGLGPGFTAGVDCDAAVETMRGHHLGRALWEGSPSPNTGTPGAVAGKGAERVIRAPVAGVVSWDRRIGERVDAGDVLGSIRGVSLSAMFAGVVRGLIAPGTPVHMGLKIGDLDPRADPRFCFEISDKALAVGGGVLEAVMTWLTPS